MLLVQIAVTDKVLTEVDTVSLNGSIFEMFFF